jgi:hypothetical protein
LTATWTGTRNFDVVNGGVQVHVQVHVKVHDHDQVNDDEVDDRSLLGASGAKG